MKEIVKHELFISKEFFLSLNSLIQTMLKHVSYELFISKGFLLALNSILQTLLKCASYFIFTCCNNSIHKSFEHMFITLLRLEMLMLQLQRYKVLFIVKEHYF